jgi:hypothetical protein
MSGTNGTSSITGPSRTTPETFVVDCFMSSCTVKLPTGALLGLPEPPAPAPAPEPLEPAVPPADCESSSESEPEQPTVEIAIAIDNPK